jgi:hypothetical protein
MMSLQHSVVKPSNPNYCPDTFDIPVHALTLYSLCCFIAPHQPAKKFFQSPTGQFATESRA